MRSPARTRGPTGLRPAWSRLTIALAAVALAILTCARAARADARPPDGGSLVLTGRASVVRGQTLVVQAGTESDDGGWGLEVQLVPAVPGVPQRPDAPFALTGQFALSHDGIAPAAGSVAGTLEIDGSLSLQLEEATGGVAVSGKVTAGGPGVAVVSLAGRFPAVLAPEQQAGAASGDQTAWRVSRAAGLTGYLLLFVNVCLGLAVRTRFTEPVLTRWRAFDLHQLTALITVGFMAVHVLALLADRFIGFTVAQLLVPFASPYRPLETALGVVGLYATLAVVASFYVRRHIGYRAWRWLHYFTFGAFGLSLVHGVTAGTDTAASWGGALYWGTAAVAGALTVWRFRAQLGVGEEQTARAQTRTRSSDRPTPSTAVARTAAAHGSRPETVEALTERARERARRLVAD